MQGGYPNRESYYAENAQGIVGGHSDVLSSVPGACRLGDMSAHLEDPVARRKPCLNTTTALYRLDLWY